MKNDQSSNPHRQQAKGQPSRNASRTPHDSMQKGKRKDTTKGPQLCLREANDVEDATQEEAEEVDDPQADEDEENQVEQDPNSEDECEPAEPDDPAAELAEVARCLTVTARRLQGLTLGRELSGGSKTIAQRTMDSTLEAPGGILFQCRVLPQQSSCASGALGTASKDLAGVSRSNVDDREECPAEEGNFRMSTRSDTTIGKQRRQVQQVPHMRKAVERGPRKQPVGRALAKGAATAAFTAFAVLFHGCQLLEPQIIPAFRMGLPITSARKLSILLEKKISKAADKGTRPKASSKRDNRNRRQDQEEEMSDDWDWGLVTPPASANPARTHRDQERPRIMDFGPPAVQ